MIDQTLARGRDSANDAKALPPPDYPRDRIVSGAFLLLAGFIGMLAAFLLGLFGLGLLFYGCASALAALSPWRK